MNDKNKFSEANQRILLAIDPGSEQSGIILLIDGVLKGNNVTNEELFKLIDHYNEFNWVDLMIVYEDIRPYTSRFNMATINTCKMIGRLEYILKMERIKHQAITRNEVKNFVFVNYPDLVLPEIIKKINRKGKLTKKGLPLKPSFQYVDDRIVLKAMKHEWKIGKPKPGKKNELGIRGHAWQALGVATLYLSKRHENEWG